MVAPKLRLTSLLRVEERLLEADYFTRLMKRQGAGEQFGYCLNAFLSAARSVSFLMQKEMSKVPGFGEWWSEQQQILGQDRAARFFLKLRNYSQKEGRISLVGTRNSVGGKKRWTYRFAGNAEAVPDELLHRDVVECCVEHVAKLARIVLACTEKFPFHCCPRCAITREGMEVLQLSPADLSPALGFAPEWINAGASIPYEQQLRLLREHVDGLNFGALRRLSRKRVVKPPDTPDASDRLGEALATALVARLEDPSRRVNMPTILGEMLLRSMGAEENESQR